MLCAFSKSSVLVHLSMLIILLTFTSAVFSARTFNNTENSIDSANFSMENANDKGAFGFTVKNAGGSTAKPKILSRRRRYVAFPEGSSFSVAFCATFGMIGNPNVDYLSWAINWGIAYDLPNDSFVQEHRHQKFPKPLVQRRHRRELYNRLEIAIDNMGYNGRDCILRTLCESSQYFYKKGTNMIEELLRTIFSLPLTKVLSFEHNDLQHYDSAYRMGKNNVYCSTVFPGCSISLIELALGQYSKPMNYM